MKTKRFFQDSLQGTPHILAAGALLFFLPLCSSFASEASWFPTQLAGRSFYFTTYEADGDFTDQQFCTFFSQFQPNRFDSQEQGCKKTVLHGHFRYDVIHIAKGLAELYTTTHSDTDKKEIKSHYELTYYGPDIGIYHQEIIAGGKGHASGVFKLKPKPLLVQTPIEAEISNECVNSASLRCEVRKLLKKN